jgi:hypothetical protein
MAPMKRILQIAILILLVLAASAFVPAAIGADDTAAFNTPYMPYGAFDAMPTTEIKIGDASILVGYAPGEFDLSKTEINAWIDRCARIVAGYYGRFPVPRFRLLIMPTPGRGVRGGTTYGYRGPATKLRLGQAATLLQLNQDWVLIHEMIHTAVPSQQEKHHWLEEGIATYVESIARVQAGNLDQAAMWMSLVKGMPNGLPSYGDAGLDNTHTWGRTYWGGAVFCLVADVRIRERTANKFGLQDAFRGIVQAGGSVEFDWSIEKTLQTGDRATGTNVLMELYNQTSNAAVDPDLPALWKKLGINVEGEQVVLDDKAPEAGVRKAIVAPR